MSAVVSALCAAAAAAAPFDTAISLGTWLGDGDDQLIPASTDVMPDGRVVVGGKGAFDFGLAPQTVVPGAPAAGPCPDGIPSASPGFCCPTSCGACGVPGCSGLPGGAKQCCTSAINKTKHQCSAYPPPCISDGKAYQGSVVVIDPKAGKASIMLHIGGRVDCVRANAAGTLLVTGDFGAAALTLDAGAAQLKWHAAYAGDGHNDVHGQLCSLAADGSAAALSGCTWLSFDAAGKVIGNLTRKVGGGCTGVARGKEAVYQTYFHDSSTGKEPIVMPGLAASDAALSKEKFRDYDYDAHQLRPPAGTSVACSGDVADARAVSVRLGDDGAMYYSGRSDGGNTLYNCQPDNVDKKINMVSIDRYTNPYNMHAAGITFVARMDAATGAVSMGQIQNTKLQSKDSSNSLETIAVAADSRGYVYLAQQASCCIANRDNLTVSGQAVGPYGGDGVLMVLSPDFKTRVHWTAFNSKQGTTTNARDVSVRGTTAAFVAVAHGKEGFGGAGMVTVKPLPGTSAPKTELLEAGYLAVLPTP